MKLCIPTADDRGLEGRVSEHFGRAPYFTVVDTNSGRTEIVANANAEHAHGECGGWDALLTLPLDAVVCRGVGRRAHDRLAEHGLMVLATDASDVSGVVEAFRAGEVKEMVPHGPGHRHGHHA